MNPTNKGLKISAVFITSLRKVVRKSFLTTLGFIQWIDGIFISYFLLVQRQNVDSAV